MPRKSPRLAPALLVATFALALAMLAPATPAAAQQTPKIAVIDTEAVLTQSATGKKALADLQTLKEKKESEGKALQDSVGDLRKRVNEGKLSLSDDKIAELQAQLEEKTIALQRFQDDANRELNKRKDEVLAGVDRKVMPIIAEISKEKGYQLIFRKFESGLVWASEEIDITAEVIQRIDSANAGNAAGAGSGG